MARVGDPAEPTVGTNDRAPFERARVEAIDVELGTHFGIGKRQDLETVVEQEPVDVIGADPSADRIGAFEDERRPPARGEPACACEAGDPGTDDDDIVLLTHDREGSAGRSGTATPGVFRH